MKKVVRGARNSERFEWTLPRARGIWEADVIEKNADGEAHHEWVPSTLTANEATDFFDYFSDGQFVLQQEQDPWGPSLPNWYAVSDLAPPDVSRCYLQPPVGAAGTETATATPCRITAPGHRCRRWKFRCLLLGDRNPE